MNWWGVYDLEPECWARWQIGPLTLFAQPKRHEWVFGWKAARDPLQNALSIDVPASTAPDPDDYTFSRYVVGKPHSHLELGPRLGDRPFIVRPVSELSLLAGQQTVLFVSTVVWIATYLNGSTDEPCALLEIPARRPSDTWFGPNTLQGELCYASRTSAHIDLDAIEPRPHRAVTPVEIRNLGSDTLPIDQLRVPIPALSLYHDQDNGLWTDTVCFVREEGDREASLTVPEASDHLPEERTLLAPPRAAVEAGTIVEAFSRFLG
ncbi:MAG: hypothetical protein OEQ25_13475 [Gammaproteobacteria bacterium]|nr:hypothetical protein [Gammaproteobacteria bacterium]MDH3508138.1 hypothetical protein [Gammaproteobacteria bacterium]